ncbi:Protein CBG08847 [Caenorhabditis briggsae]|uniref:Protein CBG08847 n=1 Tax=Caenorhabditis briggsae TaxID=6238 RepID=A8X7J0_CAEBR|nr:Protein CBG08847 [Caenorhabditis briggsae]CAP28601.2 Protein CBG08847 [Caenorhabditis briggsae]
MGNSKSNISSSLLSQGENEEHDGNTLMDELLRNQRLQAQLSAIQQQAKPVASLEFDNNSPELGGTTTAQAQAGISEYNDFKENLTLVAPRVNLFSCMDWQQQMSLNRVVRELDEIVYEVVNNSGILGKRNHSKNINFSFSKITMEDTDNEHFFELLFTLSKKTIELNNVPMYFSHRRQEDSVEVKPMNSRDLCIPEGDLIKFQDTLETFCNDVISHCKRRFPTLKLSETDGSLAFFLSHYLQIESDVLSFQMRTAMRKLNKYDPVLEKTSFLQTTFPLVINKSRVDKHSQEVSNILNHIEDELSDGGQCDEPYSYHHHRGVGSLDWVLEILFQQELDRCYGRRDSVQLILQIEQVKRFVR